jgi:hypothetical protein
MIAPEDQIRLPIALEEITAEWVTAALALRTPGVEVRSLHRGTVIHGSATKVRLLLDYNQAGHAAGLPPTLFLKGGFEEHGLVSTAGYAGEVMFYREIAPQLPVNLPGCYFAGIDEKSGQAILLLEDLLARNASFGRATESISADTAAATLGLLARLHALWWQNDVKLPALRFADGAAAADGLVQGLLSAEHWEKSLAGPQAASVPEALRDRSRMIQLVRNLWDGDTKPPHCLLHGDAHLGNMFFERDGSPGFLDWQTTQRGAWAHEYTYFLVGALSIEDRRAHERPLLEHYLAELKRHGVDAPPFDEAWLAYRKHTAHGVLWVVCPLEMQPLDIIEANVTRFTTAMTDLDAVSALA